MENNYFLLGFPLYRAPFDRFECNLQFIMYLLRVRLIVCFNIAKSKVIDKMNINC